MNIDSVRTSKRMLVVGVVILIAGGWLWWSRVYNKPENLFWRMIGNNLATPSVTRSVESGGDGQSTQIVRGNFGSEHTLRTQTSIKQESEQGTSAVVTETLATPNVVFVRYKSVDTSEKSSKGGPLDFSKIVGVWAKQDSPEGSNDAQREDYIQNGLTLVPFGNLPAALRNSTVQEMKSSGVYQFDGNKVTRKTVNGKKVVVYKVTLKTKKYAEAYQNLLRKTGMGELSALEPSSYSDTDTVEAEFAVDGNATLQSITYTGSGRNEVYSSFGLLAADKLPANSITISELQKRLQAIQ